MLYFLFQASLLAISILNYAYWGVDPALGMFFIGWCSALTSGAVVCAIAKEVQQ
ncbi:hypothetical protein [Rhizobium sp. J15]|uniref:hypothetical protein n=1 Tax=Rhizobium sp. J15 TaxID=2035450 RepID=UPI0015965641|nr:hypothetical protein [Rhizobium sp. J15]